MLVFIKNLNYNYFLKIDLKDDELNKADDIHVRLMMDYSSEVIQW